MSAALCCAGPCNSVLLITLSLALTLTAAVPWRCLLVPCQEDTPASRLKPAHCTFFCRTCQPSRLQWSVVTARGAHCGALSKGDTLALSCAGVAASWRSRSPALLCRSSLQRASSRASVMTDGAL